MSDEEVTEVPEYDDRMLLTPEEMVELGGAIGPVVETEGGRKVWLSVQFTDPEGPEEMLRIGEALVEAGEQWIRDYQDLMNNVDPDGEYR